MDIRIINGKPVAPDIEAVLRALGCHRGTPGWEKTAAACRELVPPLRRLVRPKAAFTLAEQDGRPCIFVLLTLGAAVCRRQTQLSESGDTAAALLLGALADQCLFAFEKELQPVLRAFCQEQQCGIAARHEAGVDVPLAVQRTAWELLDAKRTLGLSITPEAMLIPEKTLCLIFAVSSDPSQWHADHDCRQCPKTGCPQRHSDVAAEDGQRVICPPGPLLDSLMAQGLAVNALCGGKGLCGRCRVRLCQGQLAVTDADGQLFTAAELASGWRLACTAWAEAPVTVFVPSVAKEVMQTAGAEAVAVTAAVRDPYGVAIDMGSTTLAAALVSLETGIIVATAACSNGQRRFGADVVSRIQAANEGHGAALQRLSRDGVQALLRELLEKYPAACGAVEKITLAGNTTMEHLFMGWSCAGLGSWPFRPVSLGGETYAAADLLGAQPACTATCTLSLLPGLSTYVGADIAAGLVAQDLDRTNALTFFLDLGTNGEMALGRAGRLLTASTAAGPALEGGHLRWGMSSVAGAISHVQLAGKQPVVETIDGAPAQGLCGTGIIEAMAALVEAGLVDRHGTLQEAYFATGFPLAVTPAGETIALTQADIREIQMAKGAIRAGIETLLASSGTPAEAVETVYLAGGFGCYLNAAKAAAIGLIPQVWAEKACAAGNTALAGAIRSLVEDEALVRMKSLAHEAEEIILGNDEKFQERYIRYMEF